MLYLLTLLLLGMNVASYLLFVLAPGRKTVQIIGLSIHSFGNLPVSSSVHIAKTALITTYGLQRPIHDPAITVQFAGQETDSGVYV